jgi:hypothetical protein
MEIKKFQKYFRSFRNALDVTASELKRILQKSIRILIRIFSNRIRIFREEYSLYTNIFEYLKKVFEYLFEYSIFVSIRILEYPITLKKNI